MFLFLKIDNFTQKINIKPIFYNKNKMKDRIISLLILIAIFGGWFAFYSYYFVENKWSLTLETNFWDYEVSLYNTQLKTTFKHSCIDLNCKIEDLAPFEYGLTLKKQWFEEISQTIKIPVKNNLNLNFDFEKKVELVTLMDHLVDMWIEPEVNKTDVIIKSKRLNLIKNKYKFFDLGNLGYFYVDEGDSGLDLFQYDLIKNQSTKLYSFNQTDRENIDLQKIYQNNWEIFINFWEKKLIYNLFSGKNFEINFPQEINYIKKNKENYQIINDKWTFIYDIVSKKINYFYLFTDFIETPEYFIWIINKSETEKHEIYNLDWSKNLVVKYSPENKEIQILKEIDNNITKLYQENNKIIITSWEDIFELTNI